MATKKDNNAGAKALGIGAAIAAAAGIYFLYGKGGAQRRKKIKGWTLKMQGEVLEKMEKVQEFTEEKYDEIVDAVTAKYAGLKNIDKDELDALVADLKKHWKSIKKDFAQNEKASKKRK